MDHKNLPKHYRYRYQLWPRFGNVRHEYELIGRHGAVTFHITDLGEDNRSGIRYSAGLELHYRVPPGYMDDQPPSFDYCHVLKAPCWHDGTSLYARQQLLPFWLDACSDHWSMFRRLATEADDKFGQPHDED